MLKAGVRAGPQYYINNNRGFCPTYNERHNQVTVNINLWAHIPAA